mgnify:CR=1 FL=1
MRIVSRELQVVPNYLVLFEVDPTEPELFAVPLCDTCQDSPAAIWCPADMAKYVTVLSSILENNLVACRHHSIPHVLRLAFQAVRSVRRTPPFLQQAGVKAHQSSIERGADTGH